MSDDEFPRPAEDFMNAEELTALPSYVWPMDEVLEKAKKRTAIYYSGGFAIVEPDKSDDDVIIVISRRR